MSIHGPGFRKLALSTFFLTLPLNPAFAQEANAVADRLKAALAAQSVAIDWTGVSGDASSMVLQGVTLKATGEKEALAVGNITLEDVSEVNGGYIAGTVTTEAYSRQEKDAQITISPIVIHDLTIPAEGATDPLASFTLYKSAEIDNVTVKVGDKTAFAMDRLRADIAPPTSSAAMEFSGGADRFSADLTLVEDPKSKEAIEALGYRTISGSFTTQGTWQPADGKMTLSKYDITVDNAGTLGLTFDLGGYTLDFIRSLQELQKNMAAQPEGADKSAQGMAVLGLMQQLTFNSASIRFTDDSLTNKVLDYVGKKQGMSGRDIANQAKAIVPFGLAQLNNPELTAQASEAVGKFLDDPRSLEISAIPPAAVPFALIMANAMANPVELTRTLGVSVKANEN